MIAIIMLIVVVYLLVGLVLLIFLAPDNHMLSNWECLEFILTWGFWTLVFLWRELRR